MNERHDATPHRGRPILDRHGALCPGATPDSYPLAATCAVCERPISCADGTADWAHDVDHAAQAREYRTRAVEALDAARILTACGHHDDARHAEHSAWTLARLADRADLKAAELAPPVAR